MNYLKEKLVVIFLFFVVCAALFNLQMNNVTKASAQESVNSSAVGDSTQIGNSVKASLKVSAKIQSITGGEKKLVLKYVLQNLTGEKLIIFDAQHKSRREAVYIVPKEAETVEIGRYIPPPPPGASGPYAPRTEFSAVLLGSKQKIDESLQIDYPLIVNDPSILFPNERQAISARKIRFCIGIASVNNLKKAERGKKKDHVYQASLAEAARQEIICSDTVEVMP